MRHAAAVVVVLAACGGSSPMPQACAVVTPDALPAAVASVAGDAYSIERFSECDWLAPGGGHFTLRIEEVPDTALYIEHSVEGSPLNAIRLDIGDGAVLFEGEALVASQGDYIVSATSTVGDLLESTPAVEQAVAYLRDRP